MPLSTLLMSFSAMSQTHKAEKRQICDKKKETVPARLLPKSDRHGLGCLAGSLRPLDRLLADVDFDLLWLGFRLLRQSYLQHSLVVIGFYLLRVQCIGQRKGAGEAAILPLDAMEVLLLLFLLELA